MQGDFTSRYFEVRDPKVFAQGADCYLLAVTLRDGLLYFQASNPAKSQKDAAGHLQTIREFSEKVLKQHPHKEPASMQGIEELDAAVETAAKQLQISVSALV